MSRKVVGLAMFVATMFAVEFTAVDSAEAQLLRRNRCCTTSCCTTNTCATPVSCCATNSCPTDCCATNCCRPRRRIFRATRCCNTNCCPSSCATGCDSGCAQVASAPIQTIAAPVYAQPTESCGCASTSAPVETYANATVAASSCGCASTSAPVETYATATVAAPMTDCGCGGEVAPVSYDSGCVGCQGAMVEGAVMDGSIIVQGAVTEGCAGGGCGGTTVYDSADAVIETAPMEDQSTPIEAPAVEASDDKEA